MQKEKDSKKTGVVVLPIDFSLTEEERPCSCLFLLQL
jgi:hypothetical protein